VFIAEGKKAEAFAKAFDQMLRRLNEAEDRSFTVTASIGTTVKKAQ
jgi:hypothetical protein